MNRTAILIFEEMINTTLTISDKKDVYVGVCADFNNRNENGRLYSKEDYLKHLPYLKSLISSNSLFGEIDHPHRYEVNRELASHEIIGLWYDEETNQVKIAIKLLDNEHGDRARKIANDGDGKLRISSRASGYLDEQLNVELEKIYTYDIVMIPGFKNAILEPLNEEKNNSSRVYYLINENKQYMDNSKKNMEALLEQNELMATQIKALKSQVKSLMGIANGFGKKITALVEYSNLLGQEIDRKHSISKLPNDKIVLALDENSEFTNQLADRLDQSIKYTEYVAGMVSKSIGYSEYVANKLDESIDYTEYIARQLDESIGYSEEIAEFVNERAEYTEYLGENLNNSLNYAEYIAEQLDNSISYSELIAEQNNSMVEYADYLAKNLEKTINYSEHTTNFINEKILPPITIGAKIGGNGTKALSNKEKTKALLESAKTRKNDQFYDKLKQKYPFIVSLNESYYDKFKKMNIHQKTTVSKKVFDAGDMNVVQLMSVIDGIDNNLESIFESKIPANLIDKWNFLDASSKQKIVGQYNSRNIINESDNKAFWESVDFRKYKIINENLNEPNKTSKPSEYNALGYDANDINKVLNF